MPTTDTYSVSYITHTMRGAPVINGSTPGCLIAALDAVLVSGWGLAAPATVAVAGGIATATFASATPWVVGAVIEVTGGTPIAINGRARVLTSSSTTLTFATSAGDGSYSGAIGIKYASAGWQKVFSGTNKAVYRPTDVTSNQHYLRVDDSGALSARVVGYESMSDVDTGTCAFPTDAVISGGGAWNKALYNNNIAIPYIFAADAKAIIHFIQFGISNSPEFKSSTAFGFGEGVALSQTGDYSSTFLSALVAGQHEFGYGGLCGSLYESNNYRGFSCFSRGFVDSGKPIFSMTIPESGSGVSGDTLSFGVAPSKITGKILMSRIMMSEQTADRDMRAVITPILYSPQKIDLTLFNDEINYVAHEDGRKLIAIRTGTDFATKNGVVFLDITGPWR